MPVVTKVKEVVAQADRMAAKADDTLGSAIHNQRRRYTMKRIIVMVLIILAGYSNLWASGGQNHGTTGEGQTSTGSQAEGQASQGRTGQ
jgi:hypothetical protein